MTRCDNTPPWHDVLHQYNIQIYNIQIDIFCIIVRILCYRDDIMTQQYYKQLLKKYYKMHMHNWIYIVPHKMEDTTVFP